MSCSKENILAAMSYFRVKLLAEIEDKWVEDPKDESALMTKEQSNQLASLVNASGEQITQADIDALFTNAASGGSTGSGTAADADGVDDEL